MAQAVLECRYKRGLICHRQVHFTLWSIGSYQKSQKCENKRPKTIPITATAILPIAATTNFDDKGKDGGNYTDNQTESNLRKKRNDEPL